MGSNYASQEAVCLFDNLIKIFFSAFLTKKRNVWPSRVLRWLLDSEVFFFGCKKKNKIFAPISDRASITETVDLGLTPSRAKSKTIKIDAHSFLAWRSAIKKDIVKTPQCVIDK